MQPSSLLLPPKCWGHHHVNSQSLSSSSCHPHFLHFCCAGFGLGQLSSGFCSISPGLVCAGLLLHSSHCCCQYMEDSPLGLPASHPALPTLTTASVTRVWPHPFLNVRPFYLPFVPSSSPNQPSSGTLFHALLCLWVLGPTWLALLPWEATW